MSNQSSCYHCVYRVFQEGEEGFATFKEGWLDPVQACTPARDWGYQRPTVPFSLGKHTHGLSLTYQSALDQTCLYSLELELLLLVTERIGSPGGSGV